MSHNAKLHWYATAPQQGYEMYELWNEENRLLTVYLNQFSQTAKVECNSGRRNFRIEKEGFLRNKTILKNEYGVKIGEINNSGWFMNEGSMDMNGERLNFSILNSTPTEFTIYEPSKKQPILSCDVSSNNQSYNIDADNVTRAAKYSCLLMAMGWFILMPLSMEHANSPQA